MIGGYRGEERKGRERKEGEKKFLRFQEQGFQERVESECEISCICRRRTGRAFFCRGSLSDYCYG